MGIQKLLGFHMNVMTSGVQLDHLGNNLMKEKSNIYIISQKILRSLVEWKNRIHNISGEANALSACSLCLISLPDLSSA